MSEKIKFCKWRGITDWLIGQIIPGNQIGNTVEVKRIDGPVCRIDKARLQPATYDEVLSAIKLGGCIIPQ